MTSRDSKYSLLKDDEPRGSESGYESDGFMPLKTPQRSRVRAWLPWMAQTLIFTSSVFFFTVGTMRFNAVEKVTTFEPVYTQEYRKQMHPTRDLILLLPKQSTNLTLNSPGSSLCWRASRLGTARRVRPAFTLERYTKRRT